MTELKTLKDFGDMGDIILNEENLKAEAVKWYHRSDGDKHKFIRNFFNLTKEELGK